jgi:hypothetical protein
MNGLQNMTNMQMQGMQNNPNILRNNLGFGLQPQNYFNNLYGMNFGNFPNLSRNPQPQNFNANGNMFNFGGVPYPGELKN